MFIQSWKEPHKFLAAMSNSYYISVKSALFLWASRYINPNANITTNVDTMAQSIVSQKCDLNGSNFT